MSDKEARRPGLIQAVLTGKVSNAEAARALGLGVRQFRRLKAAYQCHGAAGLVHGNRGRPSPRRLNQVDRERIVDLIQARYGGLNDCHLTEKLREIEGLRVGRETVRLLRRDLGIAPVRRRRAPKHRARRLREAREGTWVLVDGSNHAWLEGRGPRATLLGALDDATGKILGLQFRAHEDLHGYTELLRHVLLTHGMPCALYGDRLGVFVRNDTRWSIAEQLEDRRQPTQFGHMLAELAIGYITAHSPQAKGRIERLWDTLQDRLVAELRLRSITTLADAAACLPEFIADFNRRFAHPARIPTATAWRRPPRDLDHILACRYPRLVARDNTVTVPGRWIQLPPRAHGRSWHGRKVEARELLDGRLIVFHDGLRIAEQPALERFTLVPRDNTPVQRRAELGIDLPGSPYVVDRPPTRIRTRPRNPRRGQLTNRRIPSDLHPWKGTYKTRRPTSATTGRT